jgi:hypothetical protein
VQIPRQCVRLWLCSSGKLSLRIVKASCQGCRCKRDAKVISQRLGALVIRPSGNMAGALATIHDQGERVRAITLDQTPRGVTKMHTPADAPPSSHVVSAFEATCAVGDAQDETAIRACYRLGRRSFSR